MATAREETIELIRRMPDESSLESILSELHFRAKVARGLKQADRKELISHDEIAEDLDRWLLSIGG